MTKLIKPALAAILLSLGATATAPAQIGFSGSAPTSAGGQAPTNADGELAVDPPAYNVSAGGSALGFIPMVLAFLMMGVMLGVNLMPCKRGHQD